MPGPVDQRPTALYRLYDQAGALLYIGISHQPDVRFGQHAADKPWWPQVARREVVWLSDRAAAEQAEADAVRAEDPQHNGTYSPRRCYSTRDLVADDGVRELSLTLARAQLTAVIADARERGVITALTVRGRRRACLVTPEFVQEALTLMREQSGA